VKRHLISAADLSRDDALLVLDTAEELAQVAGRSIKKLPTLRGRTVVNLFFEDSTRTRISFEAAAKRLSADVINFSAKGSSVSKGESLKDTALTLEAMGADGVVIRHNASGAPHRLANWVQGSVVNAETAPTSTRPRHCSTPSPCAGGSAAWRAARSPSSATSCTAGWHAPMCCCCTRSAPRSRSCPADPGARRDRHLAVRGVVRPGRGDPQERRHHDAAGPAGTDERAYFPTVREYSRRYGLDRGRMAALPTRRSSCTPAR